jgi:hypothetical protein
VQRDTSNPKGKGENELITILGTARLGEFCLRHEKIIRLLHASGFLGMTIDFQYSVSVMSLHSVLMPGARRSPSSEQ